MALNAVDQEVADLGITFDHNGNVLRVNGKVKIEDKKVAADGGVNEEMTQILKNPMGYQSKPRKKGGLFGRQDTISTTQGGPFAET